MGPIGAAGGSAVACTTEQTVLGEGARWDDRREELLRVDIAAGRVYRDSVAEDGALTSVAVYQLPLTVGAITPIQGDDGWLLAAGRGFVHLAPEGRWRTVAEVAPPATRMNDAACDPQGRFWAGYLAEDFHEGGGGLVRFDGTGTAELVLEGLTIPNGIGWSPDATTMYLADSGTRIIHAYDFNGDLGTLSHGRGFIEVPADIGAPDGLTVDAAGDLWVAIYGGGRVQHYWASGVLVEEFAIPAEQTTSCAFAGLGCSRLFVTTATEHWTDEQRRAQPAAGLVYRLDIEARGNPAAPFVPDPQWWATVTAGDRIS